ncbi:glycoside hydrolase family 76 protein [Zopfia rhizophila CBS 207.26]|uniref:mannan endo-1,6-alpha-mannosidase n=1 Tax=Zopfia rhizophila CBS 207.26 TaxID=1314779 RepID=A0A6A6EXG3_9PEZI|nr:glycoside hydrolase family 76 protein [Zopfia rhizophila CBS 207.26]
MRLSNYALKAWCLGYALQIEPVSSTTVDLTSNESIKAASQTCAIGMLQNYTGQIPGILGSPYTWPIAGAVFGSLVDYWYYTGNDKFNNTTMDALLNQAGDRYNFRPTNGVQGNSADQALWGLVTMSAAEYGFPDPPAGKPSWISMAKTVFEDQLSLWDNSTCGGGLSYQVFGEPVVPGFKVGISTSRFGSLAARLGAYTSNTTYSDWAEKSWSWVFSTGLASPDYHFYLNVSSSTNCTSISHLEWSAVAGTYLNIAATMWNMTQDELWVSRIQGILKTTSIFFENTIMKEVACEDSGRCELEHMTYKGQFARSLAITAKIAPFTADTIMPLLRSSAKAAAAQCIGGLQNNLCGFNWTSSYDGTAGPGQQMSVLQVIQANLEPTVRGPLKGIPDANNGSTSATQTPPSTNSGMNLGKGTIAGIVIGSVFGVAMIIGVISFFVVKHKTSAHKNAKPETEVWSKPELDGKNVNNPVLYELEHTRPQELPDNQLPGELDASEASPEHSTTRSEIQPRAETACMILSNH